MGARIDAILRRTRVPQIVRLRHEEARIELDIVRRQIRLREVKTEIDALVLAERPTFPTEKNRLGLAVAADSIRAKTVPASRPGTSIGDTGITVDGHRGWISLSMKSPYSAVRRGHSLWGPLTECEIDDTLTLIDTLGATVTDWWKHDDGISILAQPKGDES